MKEEEKEALEINVEPGEYPFPVLDGPDESRYLTWVRNNANYMAVHGFLDYMRAVGVLVRGIIINFVVLLPFALVMSAAIAWWYQTTDPFSLTFNVLLLAAAVILLYPMLTPLWNIFRHRKRLETGSDSSVKPRSRLEQLFGILLLLVLTIAVFELLAASLEPLNRLINESERNWKLFFTIMPAALAIFASADKLLAALAGLARKLMLVFIGILGMLVPLFFILLVSNYLVFESPPLYEDAEAVFYTSLIPPVIMAILIFVAFIMLSVGWLKSRFAKSPNVFTLKDVSKMFIFLVGLFVYGFLLNFFLTKYEEKIYYDYPDSLDKFWEKTPILEGEKSSESQELSIWQKIVTQRLFTITSDTPKDDKETLLSDSLEDFFGDVNNRTDTPRLKRFLKRLSKTKLYLEESQPELLQELHKNDDSENADYLKMSLSMLLNAKNVADLAGAVVFHGDPTIVLDNDLDPSSDLYDCPSISLQDLLIGGYEAYAYDQECIDLYYAYIESPEISLITEFLLAYIEVAHNSNIPIEECFATDSKCDPDVFYTDYIEAYDEFTLLAVYHSRDYPYLFKTDKAVSIRYKSFWLNILWLTLLVIPLWLITRFTVDINLTSIHGLYRDRLASAFLVGADTKGDVDIEKDLDLGEICRHEAGSTAPYHLINVALNLQGSKAVGVRDRQSDFFIFSKKFIGGSRTGYCRGETMELFFPQMGLATAMAISAAAASPNMGRSTSPALVIIMTLFNIRLGYWLPNPRRLESWLYKRKGVGGKENGYVFDEVFSEELVEISRRWDQAYTDLQRHRTIENQPTVHHSLVGVGFSGGGIRSATINLGITQALEEHGVFKHIDYMSTVSGGGYLGSSISALMRQKTKTESEATGKVNISKNEAGKTVVTVTPKKPLFSSLRKAQYTNQPYVYQYEDYANLAVRKGDIVRKGQRLLNPVEVVDASNLSFSPYYSWRVPPRALFREIAGKLTEETKWVNVSDGGHIENLAGIELLRRRCKYIIIGDGEADPEHQFNGLAILIQTARIDLGVHIDIKADPLRLKKKGLCKSHWVAGRIHYPGEEENGYLLYLKSSLTGEEDEVIKHYKEIQPSFPHESTADQFFGEGQFEAYRSLGQHIGESLFKADDSSEQSGDSSEQKTMSFAEFEDWFKGLVPDK